MTSWLFLLILLAEMLVLVNTSHFRGGIISWRALSTTPSGTTAQILVHQRYAWRRDAFSPVCSNASIAAGAVVGSGTGSLICYSGGSCSYFATITADVYCTDFSAGTDYSLGEKYTTFTLPLGATFIIAFYSSAWLALALKGGSTWQVTNKINLAVRPDGILNTSPVTSTLPVIYRTVNVPHVHVVQMSDADSMDTLRCRWATNNSPTNYNNWDECGSVCSPTLPSFSLNSDNCTIVYTITALNYYAVALQIEDFFNATSPTPMSSVPIQFLFYGIAAPSGCSAPPVITGVRPNLACIGTPIGNLTIETVIAQVGCTGKTIIEFTTSSPTGLVKSGILNPSTGVYSIVLQFTPTAGQYGPQGFCAGAIDNTNVQSDPWCITFLVGFTAPNLQPPVLVQGSASPIGTVFANQSIFSIQSQYGVPVNRPSHNGTYISFIDVDMNNSLVLRYDCGWSTNVIYSGSVIIVYANFTWTPGHHYYVTFDSGASSGNDFCHAESTPITNPNFWQFDIWNPALSSTTTTTTTPPTTHTVTTRVAITTTPSPNMTTTGIVVTTASQASITTSSTTSTTSTSTTSITFTTITTTELVTDLPVMSPKDFEDACKQPVVIATVISMVAMLPLNALGMYVMFTKIEKMFNPQRILANQRRLQFAKRMANRR